MVTLCILVLTLSHWRRKPNYRPNGINAGDSNKNYGALSVSFVFEFFQLSMHCFYSQLNMEDHNACKNSVLMKGADMFLFIYFYFLFFIVLLFTCAYKAWVISSPSPHPLPYHPLRPLPLPPVFVYNTERLEHYIPNIGKRLNELCNERL
jgi:hypothetical protein